jgi:DNA-binding transcriptional ArsR family regulator
MRKCQARDEILALLERKMSVADLVDELPQAERTIRHHLNVLQAAGMIHIGGWRKNIGTGGAHAALFIAGPGIDKKKPGKELRTTTQARYYAKNAARFRLRRRPDYAINNPFAALMQGNV